MKVCVMQLLKCLTCILLRPKNTESELFNLGENPKTVFNVGALSMDNFKKIKLMTLTELEKSISFKLDKPFFVVTFHPVTLENKSSDKQFIELLKALESFPDYKVIFTKPNADNDGRVIIKMIDNYVSKNSDRDYCIQFIGSVTIFICFEALRNDDW